MVTPPQDRKVNTRVILSADNAQLIKKIDVFATAILKEASEDKDPPISLDTKLDVLDRLARWVAVRNKLTGKAEDLEGAELTAYRSRLKESNVARRKTVRDEQPGAFVTRPYGRRPLEVRGETDGAGLAALRACLPRADHGGDDDDRDDAGGEDDPHAVDGTETN